MRVRGKRAWRGPIGVLLSIGLALSPSIGRADPLELLYVTITGNVTDMVGTPLKSVRVSDGYESVWTQPDGSYAIKQMLLSETVLTAYKAGLVPESHAVMALPGKVVNFEVQYALEVSLSVSPTHEVSITAWSHSPPSSSCAQWRDIATDEIVNLSLKETESGRSTWVGVFQGGSAGGTFQSETVVSDCASDTALTPAIWQQYTIS